MSSTPTIADFLEALPLAAFTVTADFTVQDANSAAQPLALRTSSQLQAVLGDAVQRAITEQRVTKFSAEEIPALFAPTRQLWVSPLGELALIMIDTAAPTNDYTSISATMAAMLAHEIRNPLLSIKGAAQLLGSTAHEDDAPLVQLIVNEVARIDQLIATLDPLAEAPKRRMEPLNVHELLAHAQMAVNAALPQPVAFETHYDPSLPEVSGNRDQLVQALVNLMKNAAEAAELVAIPKITLSTRYAVGDARRNSHGTRLPIAISIADNGRGVPPAFVPNLFAPFATTKTSGRGLGLAITARIAEEHGGLTVHDVPEHGGARFTLYLPIAASGANPA